MVIRRKTRNKILNNSFRLWLLGVVSSIALVAVVVSLSTRTVHADARLSRPVAPTLTVEPPFAAPPVAQPTPDSLVAQRAAVKRGDKLHGIASWYGGIFQGRKTASGERFDKLSMTACHPTLPFGSVVRVVNLANKHSVVVKINDRGDLVEEGRIIDLSFAAAQKLAMTKVGLAKVELQVISLGRSASSK
jgi:rare lipoprotein A